MFSPETSSDDSSCDCETMKITWIAIEMLHRFLRIFGERRHVGAIRVDEAHEIEKPKQVQGLGIAWLVALIT